MKRDICNSGPADVAMFKKAASSYCRVGMPESYDLPKKTKQVSVRLGQIPIHPGVLVVVTVRVIVAFLGAPDFVSHQYHRNALAHHQNRGCILHLSNTQLVHGRIGAFTFPSTVPTIVVVPSVVVVLAVSFVVLAVIRNKISECKSIVTSNEVCTSRRPSVPVE